MHRIFAVAITLLPAALFAAEKPNVIFFIADDVSWNDYGCYGSQTARTPNIDALAAHGRRFDNAYLTASSTFDTKDSNGGNVYSFTRNLLEEAQGER